MTSDLIQLLNGSQRIAHRLVQILLAGLACIVVIATLGAAIGQFPWLDLDGYYGKTALNVGKILQIGVTLLLVALLAILPSANRVLALEKSHRDFAVDMQDVASAYYTAHHGDRAGAFNLASEYDNMRARMEHLRDHPDLNQLEPEMLELAAKMSFQARDLAKVYSVDNVARAETFLQQRQQELVALNDRIGASNATLAQLRHWHNRLEMDEDVAQSQLKRIREDLAELMPEFFDHPDMADNVFQMRVTAAE